MHNLIAKICNFLCEEEGITIVEYAVGGALIVSAVLLAFATLGNTVEGVIEEITNGIND